MGGVRSIHEFTDIKLTKLKYSRMKSHHVFLNTSRPADTACTGEPSICHSPEAILVKLKGNGSTVGHVPDALAYVLASMLGVGQLMHGGNYYRCPKICT